MQNDLYDLIHEFTLILNWASRPYFYRFDIHIYNLTLVNVRCLNSIFLRFQINLIWFLDGDEFGCFKRKIKIYFFVMMQLHVFYACIGDFRRIQNFFIWFSTRNGVFCLFSSWFLCDIVLWSSQLFSNGCLLIP